MKSKLYALAAAAFFGLNANAADGFTTDEVYYIQNVESGLFLCGSNSWGTQGTVSTQGDLFKVVASGEKYTIVNQSLNPGNNTLGYNLYVDTNTNQNGNLWTIESVGNGQFTFYGQGKKDNVNDAFAGYLAQSETAGSIGYVLEGVAEVTNAAKWRFLTKDEAIEEMKKATASKPVNASFLLSNPNFTRSHSIGAWIIDSGCTNKNLAGGDNGNMCAESYHSPFNIHQTIEGVPDGLYKLTAQGFYRNDINGGIEPETKPVFYINGETAEFPVKTGAENSMATASNSFKTGAYTIDPIEVVVADGTITVGVKNTEKELWCIWDNFQLEYCGPVADLLTPAKEGCNTALTNAKAVDATAKMNADVKTALTNAISDAEKLDSTDPEDYKKATTALNTAKNNATTSINAYAAVASKISVLDAAGMANFNASEVGQKYVNNTYLDEDINSALFTAIKAQTTPGANMTALIVNNSFENGLDGWQYTKSKDTQAALNSNATYTMAGCDGARLFNTWDDGQPVGQEIADLPAGTYTLTVTMATDAEHELYLEANGSKATAQSIDKGTGVVITLDDVKVTDGKLKFAACTGDNFWYKADNFTLKLKSLGISLDEFETELDGAVIAAEKISGKMNATVAKTLSDAINAGKKTYTTVEDYQTAIQNVNDAITAAENSIKAYKAAKTALDAQKALVDGTNVYGEGYDAYKAAYESLQAKYDNNTLADEAVVNPNVATGHRASTAYNFLLTPWKIGGTACNNFDAGLYINTWSTEGNTDGSDFKVPFFEYWVADANSLADNTLSSEVNVPNGLYKVSVLTRVRAKNGVAATEATGIALKVNEGDAVDATEGAQVGETQFSLATVEAEGLVKDGILRIALEVKEANISWLSFKDVKYTKVRDLTAAEMAVAPTAIALNAASAALKPGQQTTLAVTKVTPDNATETVTWSSSDDKVATVKDGVVTAVGEGTATITATSTIDESIKATATVSVAYPSELANASFDEADAATEDLGTNGSAANTKDVSEWTSKGGVWTAGAAFAYGDAVKLNGADIPAADETHKGNALGVSVGWGSEVVFSQTIKLPAGNYTISADAYNAGSAAQGASKLGFVAANGTSYISEKNSYAIGEWETDKVTFKLTEATVGQIQIGLGAISGGSGSNAKVFFDNIVITTKTDAEIEAEQAAAAAKALAEAKDAKKAELDKLAVGDGIFYYSAASVAAAKANVDKAATIEAVAAVAAPAENAPEAGKAYAIKNTTADGYLTIASEGIKVTENAPVYFEAVDGGYVLSNGEEYLSKKSGDTWTLNTTTDKAAALKVNVVINNGQYEIKNANGSLGLDNTDSGSLIFANKNAGKNGLWTIEDWVAPAPTTPELAITDGTAVTAEADKTYDMTYTRSFSKANSWQSLALPVEFVYNDEQVELAKFTGASVEDDGTTVINIAKVKVGDVIANNQPLLISAKTAGTKEIALGEATLYNAFEKGQAIDNEGNVVITNVLTAKKTGIAGKFVMSGGALKVVGDDSNKLGVNRWYMTINVPSGAEVRFRIEGFDGEEATGIASAIAESLGAKAYSINGAQVDASNAKGVYIQNGKKFIRK